MSSPKAGLEPALKPFVMEAGLWHGVLNTNMQSKVAGHVATTCLRHILFTYYIHYYLYNVCVTPLNTPAEEQGHGVAE